MRSRSRVWRGIGLQRSLEREPGSLERDPGAESGEGLDCSSDMSEIWPAPSLIPFGQWLSLVEDQYLEAGGAVIS